jgi:Holliday junction resolvase-like predicted endonuclease
VVSRHATGLRGEAVALAAAEARGWQAWLQRAPIAGGEADLVCVRDGAAGREALLIEVKTSTRPFDHAWRLGPRQARRLWQMAEALAEVHDLTQVTVVLAVVTLGTDSERLRWLELEAY